MTNGVVSLFSGGLGRKSGRGEERRTKLKGKVFGFIKFCFSEFQEICFSDGYKKYM